MFAWKILHSVDFHYKLESSKSILTLMESLHTVDEALEQKEKKIASSSDSMAWLGTKGKYNRFTNCRKTGAF